MSSAGLGIFGLCGRRGVSMSRKGKSIAAPKNRGGFETQLPRKPDPKVVEAILKKKKAESLDKLARLTKVASRKGKRRLPRLIFF